jgi:DNA-binding winged helix-turn-helix (wHTH) protein
MRVGDIEYDHDRGLLTKDGVTLSVSTGIRRRLWFLFVNNANNVVSLGQIRETVYGGRFVEDTAIRAIIRQVRQVLIALGSRCRIVTHWHGNWELIVPEDEL